MHLIRESYPSQMASALRCESGELGSIPGGHNVFAGGFICMGFFAWHCWALRGAFLRSVFAKDWSWRALSRRSRWARLFSHLGAFERVSWRYGRVAPQFFRCLRWRHGILILALASSVV